MPDELLARFKESIPPARLSRNLRNLLLQYMTLQQDGHFFDMDDLLNDMLYLFELLDDLEKA